MTRRDRALALFRSARGQLLVGQALHATARRLRATAPTDAADMALLARELFPGLELALRVLDDTSAPSE